MSKSNLAQKLAAIKGVFRKEQAARTVLILEDDEVSFYLMTQVIRRLDPELSVCGVKSVEEAKAEVAKQAPKLIISDCLLQGGESGVEFWKFCKSRYPRVPFLLVSGLSINAIEKLASVDVKTLPKFIQKPLNSSAFQAAIKALIDAA
jgi:DNA-binding NtrC family response regulator